MTEQQSQASDLTPQQADRFRFCDLSHPVMQQLVNLKLKPTTSSSQQDFD